METKGHRQQGPGKRAQPLEKLCGEGAAIGKSRAVPQSTIIMRQSINRRSNHLFGLPVPITSHSTHPENLKTLSRSVGKKDGYTNMQGLEASREALVKKFSTKGYDIGRDDAYLCAGGSMAIWVTMQLLAGEGDNFLFPSPGFPLGLVIAKSMGLEPRFYHLQAHNKWNASV